MGDVRFEVPYTAVRDARDRAAAIASMTDEEVIAALAGASRGNDPLLANVLATAAMNRNARLLAIVQNIGEAVALLKRDGAPVLINPAFSRMLGWTMDELRQAAVHERVHPLCDEGADCPLVDALLSGREHQVDNDVLVRRDGARLPVAYTITPLFREEGDERTIDGAVLVARDMTERTREVGDLMQLATLFEQSVDAIYVRTPADIITRWNPSAEKLYGYTAEEAIGRHVSIILPPGSEGELHLIREMVFRRGQPLIFETRRRRKDGSIIEVSLSVTPLRSPEGRVLGVVTIARDITSSKQEAALIHAIVDATPAALLAVDEAGRILLASARAERMLGYARGELNWKSVEDLVPERLRVKHSVLRSGYAADPRPRPMGAELDLRARRKDGSEIPVEISLSPVRSATGLVVIAVIVEKTISRL